MLQRLGLDDVMNDQRKVVYEHRIYVVNRR
jgi:preprotein translocase subunit SecA